MKPLLLSFIILLALLVLIITNPATSLQISTTHTASPTNAFLTKIDTDNVDKIDILETIDLSDCQHISKMDWSRDGYNIAIGCDGSLLVFDVLSSTVTEYQLQESSFWMRDVSFVSTTRVAFAGLENEIQIWDFISNEIVTTFANPICPSFKDIPFWSVVYSHEHNYLAAGADEGCEGIYVWDLDTDQLIGDTSEASNGFAGITELEISAFDSQELLAISGFQIILYSMGEFEVLDTQAFIDDGQFLASGDEIVYGITRSSRTSERVSDVNNTISTVSSVHIINMQRNSIQSIALPDYAGSLDASPFSPIIFVGLTNGDIQAFDINLQLITHLAQHQNTIRDIQFNSDGTLFGSIDEDYTLIIWGIIGNA